MNEELLEKKEENKENYTEELSPAEILRRALKEAWKHPIMQETRRNLKYVGKTVVAPTYKQAAEKHHVGEFYAEIYGRRYRSIKEIDARLKELEERLEELERS